MDTLFWNTTNSQNLQKNDKLLCCLDVFSSTFHIINSESSDTINSYVLTSDWMLTTEKACECGIHDEKYGRILSYVIDDNNIIRGIIQMPSMQLLDFRLNIETSQLELIRHTDNLGYSFVCYHNGYFYQIMEPSQILHMIDPKNEGIYNKEMNPGLYYMREMLKNAIEPIRNTINEDDNPYILRMKLKQT